VNKRRQFDGRGASTLRGVFRTVCGGGRVPSRLGCTAGRSGRRSRGLIGARSRNDGSEASTLPAGRTSAATATAIRLTSGASTGRRAMPSAD